MRIFSFETRDPGTRGLPLLGMVLRIILVLAAIIGAIVFIVFGVLDLVRGSQSVGVNR